ncbi:MAG TPA: trehalose-6-phosphate synthase [Gemmatimonadaceae bacterium]|nr:trehalose-6-phosphate synthase [Gemmatimonadaceae bacterium]
MPDAQPRLITVSNRLPITVSAGSGGFTVQQSAGGLATGLRGPHQQSEGIWIGWPGEISNLEPERRAELDAKLDARGLYPVEISKDEQRVFYEDISNSVLWPICHDRLDQLPLRVEGWNVYERVNERFADAVVAHYRPGDLIWVHDYHLLRLPLLLRKRLPDARIGFFLHIPFPNPEIFFALSTRSWLVEGMLGADVIGFHTRRWRGHFTAALRRLFHVEMEADATVSWRHRRVALGVFPMGIDAAELAVQAGDQRVSAKRLEFRAGITKLLVGIDRLDYSKGIPRRLLAFERLLREHPEWRERVQLIQVAVPSRGNVGAYRKARAEVDGLVGRINGDLSTPTWSPIRYLYRSVPPTTLLALYRAADVMVVTPVRDGMNLVCKEFVASRVDGDGVLILSEFAGAADELTDALVVNPYDVDGVADALSQALTMPGHERRRRMTALRAQTLEHDVHQWADRFLATLQEHDTVPVSPRSERD